MLKHILICAVALLLLLGVPFAATNYGRALLTGNLDAVSSATVILDAPSGKFVVLINPRLRENAETLQAWKKFFSGEEAGIIFEDVRTLVARGDSGGLQMAENLMTRLPTNQMKVRLEDPVLILSKAEQTKFDIIVMSEEFAQAYGAQTLFSRKDIQSVYTGGGAP